MSDYDSSYRSLLKATRPQLDLGIENHRYALLKWLNIWGCRQFAKKYHELASNEIKDWYKKHSEYLFDKDRLLMYLTDNDINSVNNIYSDLASRTASKRKLRNKLSKVKIGPTGTAKILFALRPNTFIPWDQPIRVKLELDGTAVSYCNYLRKVRNHLNELNKDCIRNGIELNELPRLLNRSRSSLAKLIDEYYWVTITNGCQAPGEKELQRWVSWQ